MRRVTQAKFITKNFKKLALRVAVVLSIVGVIGATGYNFMGLAGASGCPSTGSACFVISPSSGSYTTGQSFNVTVSETSTDQVNEVTLNMTYNTSQLQLNSLASGSSAGSPFTTVLASTGGSGSINVASAVFSSSETGQQTVAVLNFTMLASSGSAQLAVSGGSGANLTEIVRSSDQANVWNGALTSASYTVTAASSSGGGSTGGSSGSTSGSSGSTSKTTTSSSAKTSTSSSSATSTTVAPTVSPTTPTQPLPTSTTPTPTPIPEASLCSISITVTSSNGKPIANAKVAVSPGDYVAYTNSSGVATISKVVSGAHTVVISSAGKKPVTTKLTLAPGEQKLTKYKLASKDSLNPAQTGLIAALLLVVVAFVWWYRLLLSRRFKFKPQPSSSSDNIVTSNDFVAQAPPVQPTEANSQTAAQTPTDDSTNVAPKPVDISKLTGQTNAPPGTVVPAPSAQNPSQPMDDSSAGGTSTPPDQSDS